MSDYAKIREDAAAFLSHYEQDVLLSPSAAAEACERALAAGLWVAGIEGGQWMNPGFMARLDSIWTTRRAPKSREEAEQWNHEAASFIRSQAKTSPDPTFPPASAFIVTARQSRF